MSVWKPGDPLEPKATKKPVYARSGDEIPQSKDSPNPSNWYPVKSVQDLANAVTHWKGLVKNDGLMVRSISGHPYNCVGLIFAARRVAFDIGDIRQILKWDGYMPIERNEVVAGDVVLYRNEKGKYSHIALVVHVIKADVGRRFKVISKWGPDPEFEHFEEEGYYPSVYGRPAEYWSERVPYEPERHINDRYIR